MFFFVLSALNLEMFTNHVSEKVLFASQFRSPYSLLSFLPSCHLQPVLNSLCTYREHFHKSEIEVSIKQNIWVILYVNIWKVKEIGFHEN